MLDHKRVVRLCIACLCVALLAGSAAAVSGITVTTLTNSEAAAGQSVSHTLEYEADGVSADGSTDTFYVQLPDTYAGNMSFSTVAFQNRTTGTTVPISSSTNVVDGPDDDGVQETLRTGISANANYETDDINATYEFTLTHPAVTEQTSYDVTIIAEDSATGTTEATVTDAITVSPSDGSMTATASGETTASDGETTDESTDNSMATEDGMTTESGTSTDGETGTSGGSGPGFGVIAALGAILGTALLARQR